MKKVMTLNDLQNQVGKENTERCFTEYAMLTVAKAQRFDGLMNYLSKLPAHSEISVQTILDKMTGGDEDEDS